MSQLLDTHVLRRDIKLIALRKIIQNAPNISTDVVSIFSQRLQLVLALFRSPGTGCSLKVLHKRVQASKQFDTRRLDRSPNEIFGAISEQGFKPLLQASLAQHAKEGHQKVKVPCFWNCHEVHMLFQQIYQPRPLSK